MSQALRSSDPELQALRHRYNQLCARFAETSDIDPASAAHAVQELQELSDRIVAIEVRAEMASRDQRPQEPAGPKDSDRPARQEAEPAAGVARPEAPPPQPPSPPSHPAGDSPANIVALPKTRDARDGGAAPDPSRPTAPSPKQPAARTGTRTKTDEDAALGAAMRDWLRRHGLVDGDSETAREPAAAPGVPEPAATPPEACAVAIGRAPQPQTFDFDRLYAIIKAQETQIAAVLRRCEGHRQQLDAMERRLAESHPIGLLAPQIETLSAGLDQQRQRITALAIAIQRLLQWLAIERHHRRN